MTNHEFHNRPTHLSNKNLTSEQKWQLAIAVGQVFTFLFVLISFIISINL